MKNKHYRHFAVVLVRQFFSAQITFKQLVAAYPNSTSDKDIDKLLALITEHLALNKEIISLIKKLDK